MNNIIPIFKTHGSLGRANITAWGKKDYKKDDGNYDWPIPESSPVSIGGIVEKYKLDKVVVIDDSFLSLPGLHSLLKENQLIFGVNFICCQDAKDKSEASLKTEHKISILMKNGPGYQDLVKIHNLVHTNQDYFYYRTRIDFNILKENWTDNLLLLIPPYDNFIHKNSLYDSVCVPDFGQIKPIMTFARMNLPFDYLLEDSIKKYAESFKYELMECHPVYYFSEWDIKPYMNFRAIENRGTFVNPELGDFCSPDFSWESYCKKANINF